MLHGQESVAFGDAGYQGIEKRPFDFFWGLTLAVLPFDLDEEALIGAERLDDRTF